MGLGTSSGLDIDAAAFTKAELSAPIVIAYDADGV